MSFVNNILRFELEQTGSTRQNAVLGSGRGMHRSCARLTYYLSYSTAENVQQQPVLVRFTSSTGRIRAFIVAIIVRVAMPTFVMKVRDRFYIYRQYR